MIYGQFWSTHSHNNETHRISIKTQRTSHTLTDNPTVLVHALNWMHNDFNMSSKACIIAPKHCGNKIRIIGVKSSSPQAFRLQISSALLSLFNGYHPLACVVLAKTTHPILRPFCYHNSLSWFLVDHPASYVAVRALARVSKEIGGDE